MNLDMNALLKQAQEMQQQMAEAQAAAKDEIAEASAGGGMVTAKANGAGELVELRIDPRAIDPDDPEMQQQMAEAQAAAKDEIAEASAGGGMVTAKANGAGELVGLEIDPRAIDPDDPEMLGDMVLAAANEALRAASQAVEAKLRSQLPDLGALGFGA